MANKWFDTVFLPSLLERMENNTAYPNSMIVSEKQVEIIERNFKKIDCKDCNRRVFFSVFEYYLDGKHYQLYFKGKYSILSFSVPTTREDKDSEEVLKWKSRIEKKGEKAIARLKSYLNDLEEDFGQGDEPFDMYFLSLKALLQ